MNTMRVYIQIVDSRTGISQNGTIEEPMQKGTEIANALGHFGISINNMEWNYEIIRGDLQNNPFIKMGIVKDTTKIVTIIALC